MPAILGFPSCRDALTVEWLPAPESCPTAAIAPLAEVAGAEPTRTQAESAGARGVFRHG
ncbi:MAG: hypothetical protein ACYC3Q_13215 [Gemmatimonadaceae bacterium]